MKKCAMIICAALVAMTVSAVQPGTASALCGLSALASDFYVVPTGTAGNTPTSPYATRTAQRSSCGSKAMPRRRVRLARGALPLTSGVYFLYFKVRI